MKYMVMECHPGYAVVLGDNGRFLKVANMRYEVGQTVTEVMELRLPQEKTVRKNKRRWISGLAAMAACLVLAVSMMFFQAPYASVYLTINPEVRIDVNRNDTVVGVEGMNSDGAALLENYDHRKKDLDTVMDELVDLAIDMGYLHEGGSITLSLDADEEWVVTHSDHLNEHLNRHLTDKITVTIDIEQKQPAPAAPTETIAVTADPDHYGESDYGDEATDYGSTQEGNAGYADPDDGQTDYGTSDDDGQSGYDEPDTEYDEHEEEDESSDDDSEEDDE